MNEHRASTHLNREQDRSPRLNSRAATLEIVVCAAVRVAYVINS